MRVIRKMPVTLVLIAANVIMMLVLGERSGWRPATAMMGLGAAYTPAIIDQAEYYRLFTSMFLHFDFQHLLSNMLLLFFLGEIIELTLGRVRYLAIYLIGGILGNVVSLLFDLRLPVNQMPVSAGASGAVFALIGAMAYLLIINRGRLAGVTLTRLTLLIAFSAWDGFRNPHIDGAAHMGGLLAGFVLTAILYRKPKTRGLKVDDYYIKDITQGDKDEDNMYSGR